MISDNDAQRGETFVTKKKKLLKISKLPSRIAVEQEL